MELVTAAFNVRPCYFELVRAPAESPPVQSARRRYVPSTLALAGSARRRFLRMVRHVPPQVVASAPDDGRAAHAKRPRGDG